jgi:hypothetical protein
MGGVSAWSLLGNANMSNTAICRTVVIVSAEIGVACYNFGQPTIELWFDNNRRPLPITTCCMTTVLQFAVGGVSAGLVCDYGAKPL